MFQTEKKKAWDLNDKIQQEKAELKNTSDQRNQSQRSPIFTNKIAAI